MMNTIVREKGVLTNHMSKSNAQDRSIEIRDYRFNEKDHVHELDGKALTGVTTTLGVIAKPMLIQWAANMAVEYIQNYARKCEDGAFNLEEIIRISEEARVAHRKEKEKAGNWGTEVHSEVERYIHNQMLWQDSKFDDATGTTYDSRIQKFIDWAKDNKVKFLASEKHVYSRRMWVGGICDIVCEIDGKRYVGDVKTSSGIYPEAYIQCSAYSEMLKEMGEYDKFDGVIVLNLKKDGTFDWKINYDIEGNLKCFEAALTIYRQLNAIK